MIDCELVYNFKRVETELYELGYKVSAIQSCFYIHNSKGTIVADTKTVEGLRGFAQGIQWAKEASGV